jgi:hypothetical protein
MSLPLILPDYTSQSTAAYKTAIDSTAGNYFRTAGVFSCEAQATPNMTVLVRAGAYFDNALLTLTETAQQNVTITTAPSAPNSRIDLIVYNTTTKAVQLVTGTPAVSPTVPAFPAGCLPLSKIAVGSAVTTITNANITDQRSMLVKGGGGGVDYQAFTASGTWTKPASGSMARIQLWAGGGGTSGNSAGGGGGYSEIIIPLSSLAATESVTIGAGGAAGASNGGNSTFGSWLTAYGGGGSNNTGAGGGGGENAVGANNTTTGAAAGGAVGGGAGGNSTTPQAGAAAGTLWGGSGGGGNGAAGGAAVYGGGGGANAGSAGTSKFGGSGGLNANGNAPGGGGGGIGRTGARGECRVTVW